MESTPLLVIDILVSLADQNNKINLVSEKLSNIKLEIIPEPTIDIKEVEGTLSNIKLEIIPSIHKKRKRTRKVKVAYKKIEISTITGIKKQIKQLTNNNFIPLNVKCLIKKRKKIKVIHKHFNVVSTPTKSKEIIKNEWKTFTDEILTTTDFIKNTKELKPKYLDITPTPTKAKEIIKNEWKTFSNEILTTTTAQSNGYSLNNLKKCHSLYHMNKSHNRNVP